LFRRREFLRESLTCTLAQLVPVLRGYVASLSSLQAFYRHEKLLRQRLAAFALLRVQVLPDQFPDELARSAVVP
jgi:hypothetical protein